MASAPPDASTPPAAGTAPSGPAESNAFSMFKSFSAKTALFVSNASKRTAETVKSGTKSGTQGLMTLGTSASEGIKHLSTHAAAGSQYVWNATGNVVGRFAQAGLQSVCQREAKEAPCPRIMLLCCTAICSGALASEGLFTQDGPHDLVEHLQREIQASHAASLLPPGTSPQVIASLIKHWLCSLPEPLMTFKLVPALTSATTPVTALKSILAELPLANSNALHLLLDTCNRIASNAAINDTDAVALANALAPCLLWKEARAATTAPPSSTPDMDAPISPTSPVAPVQGTPLSEEELQVFKQLLVHIITNYRSFC